MNKRWVKVVVALAAVFFAVEIVSYLAVDKSNPPVIQEPNWDSPQTRALAAASCFDCHSNETVWPWYSNIAPGSWLLWNDVREGRETLNFSNWRRAEEADEFAEVIREGEMPPWYYTLMRSNAKLSNTEKDALIAGLNATLAQSGSVGSDDGDSDDD
jgi:mono/diheme cytochrome c family protein